MPGFLGNAVGGYRQYLLNRNMANHYTRNYKWLDAADNVVNLCKFTCSVSFICNVLLLKNGNKSWPCFSHFLTFEAHRIFTRVRPPNTVRAPAGRSARGSVDLLELETGGDRNSWYPNIFSQELQWCLELPVGLIFHSIFGAGQFACTQRRFLAIAPSPTLERYWNPPKLQAGVMWELAKLRVSQQVNISTHPMMLKP